MLEAMVEIAAGTAIRLPGSLALSGKAFGQIQLAVAELDPSSTPSRVVNGFMVKGSATACGRRFDLQKPIATSCRS